jgi:hypothetical protein
MFIQSEYKYVHLPYELSDDKLVDISVNIINDNKQIMRFIKMDIPTLDKYVIRTNIKKRKTIIFPNKKI